MEMLRNLSNLATIKTGMELILHYMFILSQNMDYTLITIQYKGRKILKVKNSKL